METIINKYTGEKVQVELPNSTKYDFLLERNQHYMNNIALSFGKRKITYEEMHTRIDEYARALYKKGVRQGDFIAVCVLNTPESVYLLYALDKLGAVVIGLSPLNNAYKMRRDLEMIHPKMVITVDMIYDKIKNEEKALNFSSILYNPLESAENPFIKFLYIMKQRRQGNYPADSQNNLKNVLKLGKETTAVYGDYRENIVTDIIFTGGSSGVHKGVDLTGNGLNCVVRALDYVLILEPGMVHLGNIPFGHMAFGRLLLHYALCKNLTYMLTLKALPDMFYDELVRTQADGAVGGPIHWRSLINNPKLKPNTLKNLKQAISGGEMLKEEDRIATNRALEVCGANIEIGNGLGMTEMWAPTHVNMGGKNMAGTVGYSIPFVRSKIVNPQTYEEVPAGEAGLLLVNGPGMMLQYHNNQEETKKSFYIDAEDTKWYNTGDCVVEIPGKLSEYKFVGRKKRNFVSGVDNIYPEQIEEIVLKLPQVEDIAVTAIKSPQYQFLPKYHIHVAENTDLLQLEEKINHAIITTLGESALPGYIEYVTTPLPKTDNGKTNVTMLQEKDNELLEKGKLGDSMR